MRDRPFRARHEIPRPPLERFADAVVEIQDGRDADPRYQRDHERTCTRTTLGALLARIAATPRSNDFCLIARNDLFAYVPALLDELRPLPPWISLSPRPGMWIGPAGTRTPLHYDWKDVAIAQLAGRKRVWLLPPDDPRVENRESRFGDADVTRLGAEELVLEPGELLFLPTGWWHEVIALEPSVTVSFTGFV